MVRERALFGKPCYFLIAILCFGLICLFSNQHLWALILYRKRKTPMNVTIRELWTLWSQQAILHESSKRNAAALLRRDPVCHLTPHSVETIEHNPLG